MSEIRACEWREDSEGDWETECGQTFILNDGTPRDNLMNFCCYCGHPLVQVEFEQGPDSE